MALTLPLNFSRDIAGRDTALVPIIIIEPTDNMDDNIYLSTNSIGIPHIWGGGDKLFKPLLLNIPSLKEKINISTRKYSINSINIDNRN